MFRLSNLKDQKSEEKNQRNWSMISSQCEQIGSSNLSELNDLLVGHVVTFSTFGIQMQPSILVRTPSQIERSSS
jgi:hypothetical protein